MKFLVLSMPKDKDRRVALSRRMQESGYAYEFCWGLDADQARAVLPELQVKKCRLGLLPNEVACAIGHLKIYDECANSPFVMALEDDAIPIRRDDLPPPDAIVPNLKVGDVLILGVSTKKEYLAGKPAKEIHSSAERLDVFSIYMLRGTVAYAVRSETARAIAESQRCEMWQADAWWHFFRTGVVKRFLYLEYFTHPPVELNTSNIESERQKAGVAGKSGLGRKVGKFVALRMLSVWRGFSGSKSV